MSDNILVAGPNEEFCDRRCPFITVPPTGLACCINPRHAGPVKWLALAGNKPWRPVRRKACVDATHITISRDEYARLKADAEALAVLKAGRGATASMGMPSAGKPKSEEA